MKVFTHINKYKFYILSFLFIYLAWFLYSKYFNNTLVFPGPNKTLKTFFALFSKEKNYTILFCTFYRFIISILISMLIGTFLGVISGIFKTIEEFLHPIMVGLRTLPLASVIVFIMVVFGISNSPVIISCLMIIPIIYQAILEGVKDIDKDLMEVWKLDSNMNFMIVRRVILPQVGVFIKTALIQAIGLCFKVLIMAEFICQTNNSIGKKLVTAKNNVMYNEVFAWSLLLVIVVIILELLLKKITKEKR